MSNVIKMRFSGRTVLGARLADALAAVGGTDPTPNLTMRRNEYLIAIGSFACAAQAFEQILEDASLDDAKMMEIALCGITEGLMKVILEQRARRVERNFENNSCIIPETLI